jgi:hypothetical protein
VHRWRVRVHRKHNRDGADRALFLSGGGAIGGDVSREFVCDDAHVEPRDVRQPGNEPRRHAIGAAGGPRTGAATPLERMMTIMISISPFGPVGYRRSLRAARRERHTTTHSPS